jgi:hypothetical protein
MASAIARRDTSVPGQFWSFVSPQGRHAYPAIVHDFLYWQQTCERKLADSIFLDLMREHGVSRFRAKLMYYIVRWKGGAYWDENHSLKAAGEKRCLRQYPQDGNITWADWKQRPGVFLPSCGEAVS